MTETECFNEKHIDYADASPSITYAPDLHAHHKRPKREAVARVASMMSRKSGTVTLVQRARSHIEMKLRKLKKREWER